MRFLIMVLVFVLWEKTVQAAPVDMAVVQVNITDMELIVASLLVLCGLLWGVRKMVKMMNRS